AYDSGNEGNNDGKLQTEEFVRYCQHMWPEKYGKPKDNIAAYIALFNQDDDKDSWNLHEMATWAEDPNAWPDNYFRQPKTVR
uniref:Uncharacterized protein n=1 Tax=Plectus sambesii TaxID=2011161 RepID=A0A914XID9_9BILA